MTKIYMYLLMILVAVLLIGIFTGAKRSISENDIIRKKCTETSLYVIGNKGIATSVFDCEGVNVSNR